MNKYLLKFSYCFVLFLVFTGCKEEEFPKEIEQDAIQKIREKELSELKDYLEQIALANKRKSGSIRFNLVSGREGVKYSWLPSECFNYAPLRNKKIKL